MRQSLFVIVLVVAGVAPTQSLVADLIFQRRSTPAEPQWREAGGLLLEGMGQVFEWLAAIERKRPDADAVLAQAMKGLNSSQAVYSRLADSLKPEAQVSLEAIPLPLRERIRQSFTAFKIEIPTNESAASRMAASEVAAMVKTLEQVAPRVRERDVLAVQQLLSAIDRVERIGTFTALLFEQADKARR